MATSSFSSFFSSTRNGNKRRYCVDSDSDDEVRVRATKNNISEAWPRFIVVETADEAQPISKLSPFAIQKVIAGVSSTIDNIKRLRNGSLLIECPSKKASDGLLRLNGQKFVDRPVKVSPHRGLNTSKGVIRCRELEGLSEAEIKEGLKDQGVIDVYRVLIRKGDIRVPTNTLFVTFCTPTIPEKIKVGFVQIRVTLYIPSPMRCFQCQRFGHSKAGCKQKAVCERCGGDPHEGPCTSPPTCTNCKGNHSPSSRECPKYKFEQAIQKTKTEKKMSFSDARKEVEKTNVFSFQKSFAAAVSQRPATKSTPTQTSISYRSVGVQAGPSMLKRTEPTRNKSICTQTDESTGGAIPTGDSMGSPGEVCFTAPTGDPVGAPGEVRFTTPIEDPMGSPGEVRFTTPTQKPVHRATHRKGAVEVVEVVDLTKSTPRTPPDKGKVTLPQRSPRTPKMERNPITLYNHFGSLSDEEGMEAETS
ncbi:hypothetical protein V1264_008156 [Littorina saxatilis]|uniref:Gag-like protein n=1 Tax=Littorina saxatilis TaxID=31220 RepID=A0AAN9ASL0_9CAEN